MDVDVDVLDNVRVVLVEPSHPGNIGGAARAMKTMGLSRLALVRPVRYPDPQAEWRAAGAQDVLESVQIFDDVASAIADCVLTVGTSNRERSIPWPMLSAESAGEAIVTRANHGPVALLFGRETSGLNNDELHRCQLHMQIPANPAYPSLNLAMAVQVACYELRKASIGDDRVPNWDRPAATAKQLQAMFEHMNGVLERLTFFDRDNPGQTPTRLRRLFNRIDPDDTEVQILRGICSQIDRVLDAND
jgi:tRNA (cytidine32/uridine32-2'-O)-methyltransferase